MAEQLSPKPELLVGRVEAVASRTQSEVSELLGRHKDLIPEGVATQVVAREVTRAREEYASSRLEGHSNDNFSKTPGITIYMTDEAKVAISALFERESGYTIPAAQWRPLPNGVWEVSFDRGIYSMGMGGCQFYQEADANFNEGGRDKVRKPFTARYDDIVRVEGKSGELWQNVNFNWDGTAKTR